jgi:cell division protein FtsB
MKSLWGQGNKYLRVKRKNIDISPKAARLLLVLMLMLIGTIFIAGDVGLWNLWSAQKQLRNLQTEIAWLEQENILLRNEIEQLRTNSFAIEKIARERFGFIKPGEKVYRIIPLPAGKENKFVIPRSLDIRLKNTYPNTDH